MLNLNFPQSPKTRKLQSLTRIGSPTHSPINSPKKQAFSSLFDDAVSHKIESPKAKSKPITSLEAIHLIQDYNNKDQIREAIEAATTVKDRLHIIDTILQKREEIKENHYKIKLKRSSATIKKLTDIIINKVKKNQPRESIIAQKSNLLLVPTPSLNKSYRSSPAGSRTDLSGAVTPNSESVKKTLLSPVLKKLNSLAAENPELHHFGKLEPASQMNRSETQSSLISGIKHSLTLSINHSRQSLADTQPTPNQSKKGSEGSKKNEDIGRKIVRIQSQRTIDLRKTGWSALLDKVMAKPNGIPEVTEPVKKPEVIPKHQRVRGKTFTYSQAKAKFEHELLNYLVKHQDDEDLKNIVLESGKPKKSVIRDIETKARSKFDELAENAKVNMCSPSGSPRKNTLVVTSASGSPRKNTIASSLVLGSPRKDAVLNKWGPLTPPIDLSKGVQGGDNKDFKFKRKNNGRTTSLYDVTTPKKTIILTQASDDFIGELDESYASYTEVKLDNLYRQTNIINKNVQDIEGDSEYKQMRKNSKIRKSYNAQMQNLYQNSEEVIKLTKKKLQV